MSKRQVTVRVETFLTVEIETSEGEGTKSFTVEEGIENMVTEMDYSFTANPDYPGKIIDTEIIGHEIKTTTNIG
jgi:hypothetical protein